jgi:hypothetical protein
MTGPIMLAIAPKRDDAPETTASRTAENVGRFFKEIMLPLPLENRRAFMLRLTGLLERDHQSITAVVIVNDGDGLVPENVGAILEQAGSPDAVVFGAQHFTAVNGKRRAVTCAELAHFDNGADPDTVLIMDSEKPLHIAASGILISSQLLIGLKPVFRALRSDSRVDLLLIAPPSVKRIIQVSVPVVNVRSGPEAAEKSGVADAYDQITCAALRYVCSRNQQVRATYAHLLGKVIRANYLISFQLVYHAAAMEQRWIRIFGGRGGVLVQETTALFRKVIGRLRGVR